MSSLMFLGVSASASAPPAATPSIAHALLGAALFPTNATIFANHRQLKGKAKTVPLPKRLQKTYPACSGHADEVAGKRAAAEWDKCKNKQVFYFNLGKALELGKKSYPDEFGLKERTDGLALVQGYLKKHSTGLKEVCECGARLKGTVPECIDHKDTFEIVKGISDFCGELPWQCPRPTSTRSPCDGCERDGLVIM